MAEYVSAPEKKSLSVWLRICRLRSVEKIEVLTVAALIAWNSNGWFYVGEFGSNSAVKMFTHLI